jgi:ribokinase
VPDRSCSEFDVLVLGDCNPDLVLSGDDVEPQFRQIDRLVDTAELTIGGSGGILACGLARLWMRTALAGIATRATGGTTAQPTLQEALAA